MNKTKGCLIANFATVPAIISLLDGIPELMDSAEDELAGMDLKAMDKA
ncbi:hypothetical protein V1607_07835 [Enterobacter hormaechei subsp. xiangfangensis]